jgi:hypothetical protein
MTLFDTPSNHREKATIWRVFSLSSLFAGLAESNIQRWWAVNIPMDLGTGGGEFTSDVDIVAKLIVPKPLMKARGITTRFIFKTWEVKVSLLCKDGSARSLKAGKTRRTLTQLRAYRKFGAPEVSLLDAYVCEAGFLQAHKFPTAAVRGITLKRAQELAAEGFGYHLLPFGHEREGDIDVGLHAFVGRDLIKTHFTVLRSRTTELADPFARWVKRIDDFFETTPVASRRHFKPVVFCRACRQLGQPDPQTEYDCPNCGDDLIAQ